MDNLYLETPNNGPFAQDEFISLGENKIYQAFQFDNDALCDHIQSKGNASYQIQVHVPTSPEAPPALVIQNLVTLVVIYQDNALPYSIVIVNDGAEALQSNRSTTFFSDLPDEGYGELTVLTSGDDKQAGGEELLFNGLVVAGPGDVFNANQGNYASLVKKGVPVGSGENSASLVTQGDNLGWAFAILKAPKNTKICCVCQYFENTTICCTQRTRVVLGA